MANVLYTGAREAFLKGEINWASDNIKAIYVDLADYTFSLAHNFLTDVPGGAIVATSGNLASKTTTGGVADAADTTFTSVTGDQFEAIIIYKDTGSSATSRLIAFIDTATAGLPSTPVGDNITIQWPNDANKIFKI
jgi:hypothetical protein